GGQPAAAVALPAAAVHGGGVRGGEPLPVLLLVRRPGPGGGGAPGAEAGVRGVRLAGGGARPPGRGDLRAGGAELVLAGGQRAGRAAPAVRRPAGGAPRLAGPARLHAQAGPAARRPRAGADPR